MDEEDEILNSECPDCHHAVRSHDTSGICWAPGDCDCDNKQAIAAFKAGALVGYGA